MCDRSPLGVRLATRYYSTIFQTSAPTRVVGSYRTAWTWLHKWRLWS